MEGDAEEVAAAQERSARDALGEQMASRLRDPEGGPRLGAGEIGVSKSDAVTLLNWEAWKDEDPAGGGERVGVGFMIFVPRSALADQKSDVPHEMGHALSDLDHTLSAPAWFYGDEVMNKSAPSLRTKITRHKVFVACVRNGTYLYEELPEGYGKAVRDRVRSTDAHRRQEERWVVDEGFDGWTT